ncbi:MAG: ABC transporter ATP-binding protein [Chloroflexota bacterium]
MIETIRASVFMLHVAFRLDIRRSILVTLLTFVIALSLSTQPFWLKLLVDTSLNRDIIAAMLVGCMAALAITISIFANWLETNVSQTLQEQTSVYMDEQMARLSLTVPGLAHHEHPDYLDNMTLLREERMLIGQSLTAMVDTLSLLVRSMVTGLLLMSVSPFLILLFVLGMVLGMCSRKAESYRQVAFQSTAERMRQSRHFFRTVTSAHSSKELLVYNLGATFIQRHRRYWQTIDHIRFQGELRGVYFQILGWVLFAFGYMSALLFVIDQGVQGILTPGSVLMTIGLIAQINGYTQRGTRQFSHVLRTLHVVQRYLWFEDYAKVHTPVTTTYSPLPTCLKSGIHLHNVTFRYPHTTTNTLSDITLHLPPGSTIAIVGENGAGKTTLVKLLCRLYTPTQGFITVDDTDVQSFELQAWRSSLSVSFQDFVRFELIAREAVGVGDVPHIDNINVLEQAMIRAGAQDLIHTLPQGWNTQLGRQWPDGVDLSGGQWQKIALGRAMARQQPLVVFLDEPTASLDADAEYMLFKRYASFTKSVMQQHNGITILVSHRFSTVRMADVIVVLQKGRVVETGNHDTLMATNGLYAQLYNIQAQAYR